MKNDLRTVLEKMSLWGMPFIQSLRPLSTGLDISKHYNTHCAAVPGSSRSGSEMINIYYSKEFDDKILIGLFGDRKNNNKILSEYCRAKGTFSEPFEPVLVKNAPCFQNRMKNDLFSLSVLELTSYDAGRFITSGVICSKRAEEFSFTSSIHRMKIVDDQHLIIAGRSGGSLLNNYNNHLLRKEKLSITINIGIPPIYYLLTSFSTNITANENCKLRQISKVTGYPVELAKSKTQGEAYCYAESEYVIEGEFTNLYADECPSNSDGLAMPEFLGYMGRAKTQLPLIKITGIFHKKNPIFQVFTGPGKEQCELLSIPSEIEMKLHFSTKFESEFNILDVHYPASGGGKLLLVIKIEKFCEPLSFDDIMNHVKLIHPLCKHIYLVDEDVDIFSYEDILWAFSTRFQPSRDMHVQTVAGWDMDPSQTEGYLNKQKKISNYVLFDLTVPIFLKEKFVRFFSLPGAYDGRSRNQTIKK